MARTFNGGWDWGGCDDDNGVEETVEDETGNKTKSRHRPPPSGRIREKSRKLSLSRLRWLAIPYRNRHTFWFPTPSPFFLLRYSTLSPEDLLIPRFFLWDPEALTNDIKCSNCTTRPDSDLAATE